MIEHRSTRWTRGLLSAVLAVVQGTAWGMPAAAQQAAPPVEETGRLVGRVVDAETGRGLVGAHVAVEGSAAVATTGVEGRFVIANAPAGEHAVTVRMLGYAARTITGFAVPAGASANLDVALAAQAVAIAAITITAAADRGSVGSALNAQRSSASVTSAVTAEQIARSADSDAAAAIQRVSGVTVQDGRYVFVRGLGERYTSTSLNGSRVPSPEPERKMVPLDLFPAALLQTITTAKTFTPDMQGDFSGAQVDIRTREYPAQRRFTVSTSQGLNSAVTGALLPMAPTVGGEWLASATAPRAIPEIVQLTTRPQPGPQANAMINAMRNAWSVDRRRGGMSSSLGASLGGSDDVLGRNLGYLVSATYSAGDEANLGSIRENVEGDRYEGDVGRRTVLLGGMFNLSTMFGTHSRISLNNTYNRSADNEARLETGFYENHGTHLQIERLRYIERSVRSSQLVAQHQLAPTHRLDWSVSASGVSRQEPDRSEFVTWLDPEVPTWYNQEGAFRAYGGLTEESYEASADYRLDVGAGGRRAIRFGTRFRATTRDAYDNGYAIRSREWTPTDSRWQLPPESIFDGRFSQNGETLFEFGIFNAGGAYGADDRLLAGYGMVEWAFSPRLRFVGGARVERSDVTVSYEDVLGNRGVAEPSYTDVLPAGTLIFDLTESQTLRFSASRTLARPEYREIAPICYRSGLGEEQRCGNPDLVRTRIQNFDARWERYPGIGEMLSVALFAKRFENPIEARYQGRSGTNSLWFQNAESAVNYGVELEAMRNLSFVAERLTPLSVFANATVMRSEVTTGSEADEPRPMTGQAPYVVNAGITWAPASRSTSATLLYNVAGERIINARPSGQTVADVREMPRPALDLALRFRLVGDVSGKLDLKNLLDSPYEVRQAELLRAYHRSGRVISLGLSWQH